MSANLHRSPGVFFEANSQKTYFLGKIIPYRGSWVEFEYDTKNLLYVRIDRKRKFLATIFLRGAGTEERRRNHQGFLPDREDLAEGPQAVLGCFRRADRQPDFQGIDHPRTHEAIVPAGRKITPAAFKEIQKAKITQVEVAAHDLEGAFAASDIVDPSTGEVLLEANNEITPTRSEHHSGFADSGNPGVLP